jgi:hypothetical protein
MKALKEVGLFLSIFIGGFVLLSLSIVLVFPVTWNEVVTFPGWLAIYALFGSMTAGVIISHWDDK